MGIYSEFSHHTCWISICKRLPEGTWFDDSWLRDCGELPIGFNGCLTEGIITTLRRSWKLSSSLLPHHRWWWKEGKSSPFMAELFRLVNILIYPDSSCFAIDSAVSPPWFRDTSRSDRSSVPLNISHHFPSAIASTAVLWWLSLGYFLHGVSSNISIHLPGLLSGQLLNSWLVVWNIFYFPIYLE